MVLRLKAFLVAIGYGFLVASCAGTSTQQEGAEQVVTRPADPSEGSAPTEVPGEDQEIPEATEETIGISEEVPDEVLEEDPEDVPLDPVAAIDMNLARLEALELFEVGELIIDVPEEAYNCDGPCPGFENAEADAMTAAAQSLATLADLAEEAMNQPLPSSPYCEAPEIDANLQALAGLQIVEVGELMVVEPASNPSCYNTPCLEDIDAAEALTCERAGALANLVISATEALGQVVEEPVIEEPVVEEETIPALSEAEIAEAVAAIDANLARLEALEVVEIGEMIADIPEEAYNCYGPCPGFETAEEDATGAAAIRLRDLADTAEEATAFTNPNDSEHCADSAIDANLERLNALNIVEVGDLLAVYASSSGSSYNSSGPSASAIAAAKAETCLRAIKLADIADAAEEL